jgi:hypothetical protein
MVPRIAMMKALQQHSREHRAGSAPKPPSSFGDGLVLSAARSFSKESFLMPG